MSDLAGPFQRLGRVSGYGVWMAPASLRWWPVREVVTLASAYPVCAAEWSPEARFLFVCSTSPAEGDEGQVNISRVSS